MASKRPTTFSMRMPEDLNERIMAYAAENSCTKAEAMTHFARAGIELEDKAPEPQPEEEPENAKETKVVTSEEFEAHQRTLESIDARLEALQNLPSIEPAPDTAIVPVDIRPKILEYSEEHECSEQEALTYYARIGIQATTEPPAATAADVAELARRIDLLAQDSQTKTEQLQQMAETLMAIHEYTKPDELVLEGELGEPEAEDVPDEPELTDEDRQRIADEHTRQVMSEVMDNYLAKQQADEAEREAQMAIYQSASINPWVPVLVAVIISLLIGILLVLTR